MWIKFFKSAIILDEAAEFVLTDAAAHEGDCKTRETLVVSRHVNVNSRCILSKSGHASGRINRFIAGRCGSREQKRFYSASDANLYSQLRDVSSEADF